MTGKKNRDGARRAKEVLKAAKVEGTVVIIEHEEGRYCR